MEEAGSIEKVRTRVEEAVSIEKVRTRDGHKTSRKFFFSPALIFEVQMAIGRSESNWSRAVRPTSRKVGRRNRHGEKVVLTAT